MRNNNDPVENELVERDRLVEKEQAAILRNQSITLYIITLALPKYLKRERRHKMCGRKEEIL